jgi:ABC-type Fe3+ transport system substrate-binding protein
MDLIKEDEVDDVRKLQDPKFQGKLFMTSISRGSTWSPMASVYYTVPNGPDVVRKLIVDQQPVFSDDSRQVAEAVVRGSYPVGLGVTAEVLQPFKDAGVADNVKLVDVAGATALTDTSISIFNKAPHPNASAVFINWFLSKPGQEAWIAHVEGGTRRLDVAERDQSNLPVAGRKYWRSGPENSVAEGVVVQQYLAQLVKQ